MAESNFTIRVPDDLKEAFTEAARARDRTGAQLIRDFMRSYIGEAQDKAEYEVWFKKKVEAGIRDLEAGRTVSGEDVEKYFAEKRAAILKKSQHKAS